VQRRAKPPGMVLVGVVVGDDLESWIQAEVREKRLGKKEAKDAAGIVAKARSRVLAGSFVDVDAFRVPGATLYAWLCGATLARAHA